MRARRGFSSFSRRLWGSCLRSPRPSAAAHAKTAAAGQTSPLGIVSAATPRFPVARFLTQGAFPQARDGKLALGAVNDALRQAIVSDQRAFAPTPAAT
jgi:hypothetical protein